MIYFLLFSSEVLVSLKNNLILLSTMSGADAKLRKVMNHSFHFFYSLNAQNDSIFKAIEKVRGKW